MPSRDPCGVGVDSGRTVLFRTFLKEACFGSSVNLIICRFKLKRNLRFSRTSCLSRTTSSGGFVLFSSS